MLFLAHYGALVLYCLDCVLRGIKYEIRSLFLRYSDVHDHHHDFVLHFEIIMGESNLNGYGLA